MVRILLTGATGYLGGDVLYRLQQSSLAKSQLACLIRDTDKARHVSAAFPEVEIVQGGLDDSDLVEQEARKADVVLNLAALGHAGAASAIAKGLQQRAGSQKSAHWIQIGGASALAAAEIAQGRYGGQSQETYDDIEDVDKIKEIIKSDTKRIVENNLMSQPTGVRTALLIVPLIYGNGRGLINQRSMQAPGIARCIIELGHGFRLQAGRNAWSNIHIHDLSDQIIALTEAAINLRTELWNEDGIYCVEGGKMTFGDLCSLITMEAHAQGLIDDPAIKEEIGVEKADSMSHRAAVLWGANAVLRSSRSQARLGWIPRAPDLSSEIASIVKGEAASLYAQR